MNRRGKKAGTYACTKILPRPPSAPTRDLSHAPTEKGIWLTDGMVADLLDRMQSIWSGEKLETAIDLTFLAASISSKACHWPWMLSQSPAG